MWYLIVVVLLVIVHQRITLKCLDRKIDGVLLEGKHILYVTEKVKLNYVKKKTYLTLKRKKSKKQNKYNKLNKKSKKSKSWSNWFKNLI